jgi:hypothetical protein
MDRGSGASGRRRCCTEQDAVSEASLQVSENSAVGSKLWCEVEQFSEISAAMIFSGNLEQMRAACLQELHAWNFLKGGKPNTFCSSGMCQLHHEVKLVYLRRLQDI